MLSVSEAMERNTTRAWSMAGLDATMAVVGVFVPVVGITYGLVRFGMEMYGVDAAGAIDNFIK